MVRLVVAPALATLLLLTLATAPSASAAQQVCRDTTEFLDGGQASCDLFIPRCSDSNCPSYRIEIEVRAHGLPDGAATPLVMGYITGSLTCLDVSSCKGESEAPPSATFNYWIDCAGSGVEREGGPHGLTALTVICTRVTI